MVQAGPVTTSPSASVRSGRNSVSLLASMRGASPICIARAGIDDGDLTSADDVGHGPLEREWPGIVGEQPPHAGRRLLHRFRRKVEAAIERNIGAHAHRPPERTGRLGPHSKSRSQANGRAIGRSAELASNDVFATHVVALLAEI